jgi:hypothetical protein
MADCATPVRSTDYGRVFGGSKTMLHGRVSNINRPSDFAGVCGAAGAGLAVGGGARDRADQPEGRGAGTVRPVGLMANADVRGQAVTLK